jgi:hypothetical protein
MKTDWFFWLLWLLVDWSPPVFKAGSVFKSLLLLEMLCVCSVNSTAREWLLRVLVLVSVFLWCLSALACEMQYPLHKIGMWTKSACSAMLKIMNHHQSEDSIVCLQLQVSMAAIRSLSLGGWGKVQTGMDPRENKMDGCGVHAKKRMGAHGW